MQCQSVPVMRERKGGVVDITSFLPASMILFIDTLTNRTSIAGKATVITTTTGGIPDSFHSKGMFPCDI